MAVKKSSVKKSATATTAKPGGNAGILMVKFIATAQQIDNLTTVAYRRWTGERSMVDASEFVREKCRNVVVGILEELGYKTP